MKIVFPIIKSGIVSIEIKWDENLSDVDQKSTIICYVKK